MKFLFTPAIALMNRMGYHKKFALLWLMCLIAILALMYNLFVSLSQVIRASQQELEGIALIKPVSRAIQSIQQHRGIWVAHLAGQEAIQTRFAAREQEAALAFAAMEEKLPAKLKETEEWQNIKTSWEDIEKQETGLTPADNFAAHTRLIGQIQAFAVAIADQYKLILDPQIDTYYLIDTTVNKLPDTLEHLGQLRAYGIGVLTRKQITEAEKITVHDIIAVLQESLAPLDANLAKTGRHNAALQGSLAAISRDIANSARQISGLVKSDILTGRFATSPEDFFSMASMAIDSSYAQMHESLLPTTEKLLKERIADAEHTLRMSVSLALLLILVAAYFAAGIYYATIGSIESLARSSHAFADGNLHERVKLDTRDELAQVADSFNKMADGFSALLEARKQAEENLRKYNEELKAANHQLSDMRNLLLQTEKMSAIGQLAAGVAHEINNPIGYVHSNLGTLEKYIQNAITMIEMYEDIEKLMTDDVARMRLMTARKKLDIDFLKQDLHALMDESKDGITRVKNIVQNLKDFSHVDASDEWHYADLHKGLDSTLNIVTNEIKYKASVVKEYGALPEVECLPSQLNQVFMNLLVNAAHAIEERGTITIRTGSQGDEVWVEIADTGKGIPPENLKKIFDPFFTTKPVGKGTGLGLSLSYGIVQKHHGRIEVQSEVGRGTAFRVWLPVRQQQ